MTASQRPADPTITGAVEADWPKLAELLRACELPCEGLKENLETTLVARADGEIVGSAAIESHPGEVGILRSVAVSPQLRSRGLGVLLTTRALDLARSLGLREVLLLTNTAEPFFARFGFQPIDRRDAPAIVQTSTEFVLDSCRSATVMRLFLPKDAESF